jgi:hypothetical protein
MNWRLPFEILSTKKRFEDGQALSSSSFFTGFASLRLKSLPFFPKDESFWAKSDAKSKIWLAPADLCYLRWLLFRNFRAFRARFVAKND